MPPIDAVTRRGVRLDLARPDGSEGREPATREVSVMFRPLPKTSTDKIQKFVLRERGV
jgi:hypothetical protein